MAQSARQPITLQWSWLVERKMRRWWLAMLTGLALCASAVAGEAAVPVPMIGAVEPGEGMSWIALPTGKPVRGPVGVVTLEGMYQCCYAVGPKKARADNRFFDDGRGELVWHTLTALDGAKPELALGIAVPAGGAVSVAAVPNGAQFTWRGRSYRLTQCASSEGMHLLLDAGDRRLRHYYFYLGYDTEPDCDVRDLERPEQPS